MMDMQPDDTNQSVIGDACNYVRDVAIYRFSLDLNIHLGEINFFFLLLILTGTTLLTNRTHYY